MATKIKQLQYSIHILLNNTVLWVTIWTILTMNYIWTIISRYHVHCQYGWLRVVPTAYLVISTAQTLAPVFARWQFQFQPKKVLKPHNESECCHIRYNKINSAYKYYYIITLLSLCFYHTDLLSCYYFVITGLGIY